MILQFTVTELLSLFGLIQSIYILVYIAFRSGHSARAIIPIFFFTILAFAFLLGAAESRWQNLITPYGQIQWAVWLLCTPISLLLIFQVARITQGPSIFFWLVLLLVPCAYYGALALDGIYGSKADWLLVNALIVGAVTLLIVWSKREWLDGLLLQKSGKERWWLIICLLILNVGLLFVNFMALNRAVDSGVADMIRAIIGISFVYVASTSLFRIYPQAMTIIPKTSAKDNILSEADREQALKIENLLNLEKVYQEPAYGRANMAKELSVTEAYLSRIVNLYFQKSVPRLLNEYRVEEAKTLLVQTDADVTIISAEAGFNSIATFNRVFKEIEGVSPSEFRAGNK